MFQNRLVIKLAAFLLIVLLSQKIGFGIYFHNAQHILASKTKCDERSVGVINYHCNCIDDFSMPFTATNAIVAIDNHEYYSNFILTPVKQLPVHFQFYNSLRAPPAFVS